MLLCRRPEGRLDHCLGNAGGILRRKVIELGHYLAVPPWRVKCYSERVHTASGGNSAVECQLPKLDVAGSIPVPRSIVSDVTDRSLLVQKVSIFLPQGLHFAAKFVFFQTNPLSNN